MATTFFPLDDDDIDVEGGKSIIEGIECSLKAEEKIDESRIAECLAESMVVRKME